MLGISVDNPLGNMNASLSMTFEGRLGASVVVGTSVQLYTTMSTTKFLDYAYHLEYYRVLIAIITDYELNNSMLIESSCPLQFPQEPI